MFCTYATHSAGKDFAFLGDETAKFRGVFVVYLVDVFNAEKAYFLFGCAFYGTRCFHFVICICHVYNSLIIRLERKVFVNGTEFVEIDSAIEFSFVIVAGGEELNFVRRDFGHETTHAVGAVIIAGLD